MQVGWRALLRVSTPKSVKQRPQPSGLAEGWVHFLWQHTHSTTNEVAYTTEPYLFHHPESVLWSQQDVWVCVSCWFLAAHHHWGGGREGGAVVVSYLHLLAPPPCAPLASSFLSHLNMLVIEFSTLDK